MRIFGYLTGWNRKAFDALIIVLWAVELAFVACALAGMVAMTVLFIQGVPAPAVAALGIKKKIIRKGKEQ